MTYRIDRDGAHGLAFEGLLDDAALAELRARVIPGRTRLHLRAGTEIDPVALDALRALPLAALDAASPYLARRLTQDL
jgi:hypothetical protein